MRRLALLMAVLLVVLAGVCLAGASSSAGSVEAHWAIRDLGTFGGERSEAVDVNELGQVLVQSIGVKGPGRYVLWENGKARSIGESTFAAPVLNDRGQVLVQNFASSGFHFLLWEDGRVRDLGVVNGGVAVALGNQGSIAVAGSDQGGGVYRWRNGRWTELPRTGNAKASTVGGSYSTAWDVNSRGQAVGVWNPTGLTDHAALWQNGRWTALRGLPSRYSSSADCINERGEITGVATFGRGDGSFPSRAFALQRGKLRQLGTLGGPTSRGGCMNSRGQIVGMADTKVTNKQGGFVSHAFLWQNGHMTDLGTVDRGTTSSRATEINDHGQIVGTSDTTLLRQTGTDGAGHSLRGTPFTHAFVWHDSVMVDLGTLGGKESEAVALNNHNQIAGWATTKSGQRHAVLWTLKTGS